MRTEKIMLPDEENDAYLDAYIATPVKGFKRKALLIMPGGAYACVCDDREGEPVAQAFIPYGYQAFVLHYHVSRKKTFPIQLIQAAKAIKHIKDNSEKYGIDPEQLFVVGFSAGGHLAASTGILWKHPAIYEQIDMPYGYNKPKGIMLLYPVISEKYKCASFRHLWLTSDVSREQLRQVSLDYHVDGDSAPAFIVHGVNDGIIDVRNSLTLADAYTRAGLSYEMHIFPNAPHGISLGNDITAQGNLKLKNATVSEWVRLAAAWAESL